MSRYSKLLTRIIAESGFTAKEIVEKCNELGNGIDTTRLSKLQSGKLSAPSAKVSRDIARVCNADERLLVLEGYLEKAPQEIIDTFISIKMITTSATLNIFKNNIDKQILDEVEQELNKEPIADFIVSILDTKTATIMNNNENIFEMFNENNDSFSLSLREPIALPVEDNAMFPIIPKNSKVNLLLENEYKNGDLLAIRIKESEETLFRYVLFNNDEIILNSLNREYETLTLKKDDVVILGKVIQVITNI